MNFQMSETLLGKTYPKRDLIDDSVPRWELDEIGNVVLIYAALSKKMQ